MRRRSWLAVSVLAVTLGCGGEPKAPPKGVERETPSVDLDLGTTGGDKPASEEKKDNAPPAVDATPSDKKPEGN